MLRVISVAKGVQEPHEDLSLDSTKARNLLISRIVILSGVESLASFTYPAASQSSFTELSIELYSTLPVRWADAGGDGELQWDFESDLDFNIQECAGRTGD